MVSEETVKAAGLPETLNDKGTKVEPVGLVSMSEEVTTYLLGLLEVVTIYVLCLLVVVVMVEMELDFVIKVEAKTAGVDELEKLTEFFSVKVVKVLDSVAVNGHQVVYSVTTFS